MSTLSSRMKYLAGPCEFSSVNQDTLLHLLGWRHLLLCLLSFFLLKELGWAREMVEDKEQEEKNC